MSGSRACICICIRNGTQGGTGWATTTTVSASLGQAGVEADDGMVLLLANQQPDDTSPSIGSAREQFRDAATAAMPPFTRLVHWPSIIDFLEEGSPGVDENCATSPERKKRHLGSNSSSTTTQSAKAPRLYGEPTTSMKADNEEPTPGPRRRDNDRPNPEVTPESTIAESRLGSAYDDGDIRGEATRNSCGGLVLLDRGLCQIEAGLMEMESDGARLPSSRIADAMDTIRDILKVKAGVHWGAGGWRKNRPSNDREGPHDDGRWRHDAAGATSDCCKVEGRTATLQALDTKRLVSAACAAGKRGDISALEVSIK